MSVYEREMLRMRYVQLWSMAHLFLPLLAVLVLPYGVLLWEAAWLTFGCLVVWVRLKMWRMEVAESQAEG